MEDSSASNIDRLNSVGSGTMALRRAYTTSMRRKSSRYHSLHNKTIRRRGSLLKALEVMDPEELLQNEDFVDAPADIQAACLRKTNTTLHEKKHIMQSLHGRKDHAGAKLGCCEQATWKISHLWSNFKHRISELKYSLELWRSSIKLIEGHFGTGVTSYFRSLRRLFILNLVMMFLIICFVTIPQTLYRYLQQEPPGYINNVSFTGAELLTGGGWFLDTELYYGYYHNGVVSPVGTLHYDMRYAYICVLSTYYIITVIVLSVGFSQSYNKHYIEESGGNQNFCIVKVLSGWDYKISSKLAANIQHSRLYQELQEYLVELHSNIGKQSVIMLIGMIIVRMIANILVLAILAGAGYLMWYITVTQSITNQYGILSDLAIPLCTTAINIFVPFFFSLIGYMEKYKNPRAGLILNMLRTVTLYLVTLGVLVYSWLSHTSPCVGVAKHGNTNCEPCWESFIGMQIYALVVFDFIFTLLVTLFSELFYRLIVQHCCKRASLPEFDIAKNTLNLMYSQILVWLGTYYSPLLSVIHITKLLILFSIKRISLIKNCAPPSKPWRAGQTSTVIQLLLLISLLATVIGIGYGIVFIAPSQSCGPYQSYNKTYEVLEELLDQWNASEEKLVIKSIIKFIFSDVFQIYLLIILGIAAYYCKVICSAHEETVKALHRQIVLEGKDKKFLLNLIQSALQHQNNVQQGSASPENRTTSNNNKTTGDTTQTGNTVISQAQEEHNVDTFVTVTDEHVSPSQLTVENVGDAVRRDTKTPTTAAANSFQTLEITNPVFRAESLNRLPDLPYPLPHYDITS